MSLRDRVRFDRRDVAKIGEDSSTRITDLAPSVAALQLHRAYKAGTIQCPVQAVLAIDRANRVCISIVNVSSRKCFVLAEYARISGWSCEAVDPACGSPLDGVELLNIDLMGSKMDFGAYAPGSRFSASYVLDGTDVDHKGIRNGSTSLFVNVNVNGNLHQLEPVVCLLKGTLEEEFDMKLR